MAKVLILSIAEEEESLIDKIMAVVNNSQDGHKTKPGKSVSVISIGKLQINMTQHSVYKDGKQILLTYTEFKMLYYFASNNGMALSKDQICNYIWNGEYALDDSKYHIGNVLHIPCRMDESAASKIRSIASLGFLSF